MFFFFFFFVTIYFTSFGERVLALCEPLTMVDSLVCTGIEPQTPDHESFVLSIRPQLQTCFMQLKGQTNIEIIGNCTARSYKFYAIKQYMQLSDMQLSDIVCTNKHAKFRHYHVV